MAGVIEDFGSVVARVEEAGERVTITVEGRLPGVCRRSPGVTHLPKGVSTSTTIALMSPI